MDEALREEAADEDARSAYEELLSPDATEDQDPVQDSEMEQ
jgi:hypothetical protein